MVALALRELELGDEAVRRGLDWTVGMQSRSGGWGAFDADNEALWLYKLPICDFGKVTDEPSADVTAHALEALGHEPGYDSAIASGLDWLLAEQEPDGSWFGRWGVNHVYGTGAAVPALEACGVASGASGRPACARVARLGPAAERCLRRGHPLLQRPGPARSRRRRRPHRPPGPCWPTWRAGAAERLVHAARSRVSLPDSASQR